MFGVRTNQAFSFGEFGSRQLKAFAFTDRKSIRAPKDSRLDTQRNASRVSTPLKTAAGIPA